VTVADEGVVEETDGEREVGGRVVAGPGSTPSDDPPLTGALAAFDSAVDSAFDRLRGREPFDTAAAVLSNLADYGFVWSVVAGVKGRRRGVARRRAVRALSLSGAASFGTNAVIKLLVDRGRPKGADGPSGVRTPTSSSFPSGHTLAAFCTAVVLADSPVELAAYLAFAGAVAASRVHLRAHHPSDVAGGAVVGSVLGFAVRRMVRAVSL
jgi:membrane-associated phospholipid phosphatase